MALQAARSPARLGAGRLPRRIVAARALNYRAASVGPSRSEALQRAIQVRIRHRSPYCLRLQPGLGRMGAHVVHAHPHSRLQPQGGVSRRVQARRPRRCCSRRAARPRAARVAPAHCGIHARRAAVSAAAGPSAGTGSGGAAASAQNLAWRAARRLGAETSSKAPAGTHADPPTCTLCRPPPPRAPGSRRPCPLHPNKTRSFSTQRRSAPTRRSCCPASARAA